MDFFDKADAARTLWRDVLKNPADEMALNEVLRSVLIDWVDNRMARDDEFALVIGRRLRTMLDAIEASKAI